MNENKTVTFTGVKNVLFIEIFFFVLLSMKINKVLTYVNLSLLFFPPSTGISPSSCLNHVIVIGESPTAVHSSSTESFLFIDCDFILVTKWAGSKEGKKRRRRRGNNVHELHLYNSIWVCEIRRRRRSGREEKKGNVK